MAGEQNYNAGQASMWVQPDGPNTKPEFLGCHGMGDVTEPKGDVTLKYCPDPAASGGFKVKSSVRSEPGIPTTSIETDLRATADYLEDIGRCGVPIYLHKVCAGRRDVFSNFERSFIFDSAMVTQATLSNLAARSPDAVEESGQSFDISINSVIRAFKMVGATMSSPEPGDLTSLAICGEDRCEGDCGAAQKYGDSLFAASKAPGGSAGVKADVIKYVAGVWSNAAADPFVAAQDIQGAVCFYIDSNTTRLIVGRGTAATGAAIAYSDDSGATWTIVAVSAIAGEFVSNGHALVALDMYHIWLGTSLGTIYFSDDGGLTWTQQEDGSISATAIKGISFVSSNVGFAVYVGGQIAKTTDGGVTWSAATVSGSAAATDIHTITPYFVWVSGTDGLFFSMDGAVTWTKRNSYAVAAIDFTDQYVGYAVGSATSGLIYQTINGGYNWEALPAITNTGMLDVQMVSPKLGYVVGKAGVIIKLQPAQ